MGKASSVKANAALSITRRTSTRLHRDFDSSFTTNQLTRAGSTAGIDDEPDSSVEGGELQEKEALANMSEEEKRRMLERKAALRNHEWIAAENFSPCSVQCIGCSKQIRLDRRQLYYPAMWHKHVFRCKAIRDHYYEAGQDMPIESLIAELGKVKAQQITDDRKNGIILNLTSAPEERNNLKRPKTARTYVPRDSKSITRMINTQSFSADSAWVSSSASSSNSSCSPAPSTPPPSHDENDEDVDFEMDEVPLSQKLRVRVSELAAAEGMAYCCGYLQKRPREHELEHQLLNFRGFA